MRNRVMLTALLMTTLLLVAAAPGAMASGGVTIRPHRVDFGRVPVDCFTSGRCPTARLMISNKSKATLRLDSLSVCGQIISQICISSPKYPDWGGIEGFGDCDKPLAAGASCTFMIVAVPDVTGPINGFLAVRSQPVGELILRVPVSVFGT